MEIQRHHYPIRKSEGGTETIEVTKVEHALLHFDDFKKSNKPDDFDAFASQLGNMSNEEQEQFYKTIELRWGIKLRLY